MFSLSHTLIRNGTSKREIQTTAPPSIMFNPQSMETTMLSARTIRDPKSGFSFILSFLLICVFANATSAATPIKNVLFLISDDLRANVLSCYGDDKCKTPNIDRLAKSGMLFRSAYCQATWCAPSRQSLMFSRYTGNRGTNMGEHFRKQGWYTARVGKIYHMRVPGDIIAGSNGRDVASSWTERFNSPGREAHTPGDYQCLNQNIFTRSLVGRESTKMKHRPYVAVISDGDGSDQPDYKTATKGIELLRAHQKEKFFLALGFVRPHYPMVQPKKYFDPYPWDQMELPKRIENDDDDIPKLGISASNGKKNGISRYPDNQKRMWSAYYASVTFMDEQVGRVLNELDRLGLRKNTAVIFTSDHGYHLGDHGFWQKANMHEQVIRVPLIVSAPGFSPGASSSSLAELADIYPTACELTGIEIPADVQGESLVPVLNSPTVQVRDAALTVDKGYSLRTQDWHFIQYKDGTEELYDMKSDPNQFHNLGAGKNHDAKLQEMRERLAKKLAAYSLPSNSKKRANAAK